MRQPSWRQWLVMSVLGAVPALGCNHASHHCNCVSTMQPAGSVVMLPSPTPETVVTASAPKPDTTTETVAKLPEPTGTVTVPMVIGPSSGSPTGTIELTAADAEAMGVKPGYTPGALFMPPPK